MAERPLPAADLLRLYGPHLSYTPPGGWDEQRELPVDRRVKTHGCPPGWRRSTASVSRDGIGQIES